MVRCEERMSNKEIAQTSNLEGIQKELEVLDAEIQIASEYVINLLELRKSVLTKKLDMLQIYNEISEEELRDLYQSEYYNEKMGH